MTSKPRKQQTTPDDDVGGTQVDRFLKAARDVGADEDPEAFKDRLKKLVKPVHNKDRKPKKPTT